MNVMISLRKNFNYFNVILNPKESLPEADTSNYYLKAFIVY